MAYSILDEIENHDGLLTVEDLARIYRVTRKSIYVAIDKGKLLPIKGPIGKMRFDPKTLAYKIRKDNPEIARAQKAAQLAS